MRLTVNIGSDNMRIPIDEGSKTIAWLQAEIIRRWEKLHKGEYLNIHEIRTADNVRLDNEDQIYSVCKDDERLIVILGVGSESEIGCGDMIKQYYIEKLIGEGTYGRVYKAHDLNLNRFVAVKVLRREKMNDINTRRFLREAELNGRLSNNPYVVTVHDFGRTRGGNLFIVMELLKGRPLNELLDERIASKTPFTVLECIQIMSPVLRGLHAAHTHNPSIVHRDLKPDNIWLNDLSSFKNKRPSDHLTKIMDFGISVPLPIAQQPKSANAPELKHPLKPEGRGDISSNSATLEWPARNDQSNHPTLACGTRMYSSPEQTRRNATLDGRSDIWSAGVILYQMFSLLVDVPFDPIEIVVNKTRVPPLSMYTATPLSAHMHALVMKALEVDPNLRWQSAEEMGDALAKEEARLLDGVKSPTTSFNVASGAAATKHETNTKATVSEQHATSLTNTSVAASVPINSAAFPNSSSSPRTIGSSSLGAGAKTAPASATSSASSAVNAAPSSSSSSSSSAARQAERSRQAAAAAQSHPRYGRKGMAFASGEEPQEMISSKL